MQVSVHSADIEFRGQPARLVLALDVTERLRDQERLAASEQRFQLVARATSDAVFDWNIVTGESWRTDSFDALFGYRSAEMPPTIGGWRERVHPDDRARRGRAPGGLLRLATNWSGRTPTASGAATAAGRTCSTAAACERDAQGKPLRMVGGMIDVTHQHETEAALRRQESEAAWQASHDELTGLLNRNGLLAALEHLTGRGDEAR